MEFRLLGEQILTKLDCFAPQTVAQSTITALAALMQQTSVSNSSGSHNPPALLPTGTSHHYPVPPCRQFGPAHSGQSDGNPGNLASISDGNLASVSESSGGDDSSDPSSVIIPVSGAVIPGVGKDSAAWKRAIDQWYHGDPSKGLMVPLKDWPTHWYTGSMRLKTGALYSARKLLAEEYEKMGSNDDRFMEAYPEYPKITALLIAIRKHKGLVRRATT
ncbi:hypothetical protein B0H12DRAFT_1244257 [Mycena haematopus]|nr:hypothetical protein B0H12DRAFT_1244257 [Mycena haematopus]